ncbi:uncharacterized protein TM35_000232280 [Trypanosoma theileri]|uniref:Uncharacterized protein n=1 Tax=Trypanosoma theileri TaxID=67003 RepID=A0A1X0NRD8_9TRYP|nr:uncharacterized protein TM35_000232280 [Trypanosoma theileri]ORC87257.1 hypothetical protein TM35_000232280 [Trypanosoma theileri]
MRKGDSHPADKTAKMKGSMNEKQNEKNTMTRSDPWSSCYSSFSSYYISGRMYDQERKPFIPQVENGDEIEEVGLDDSEKGLGNSTSTWNESLLALSFVNTSDLGQKSTSMEGFSISSKSTDEPLELPSFGIRDVGGELLFPMRETSGVEGGKRIVRRDSENQIPSMQESSLLMMSIIDLASDHSPVKLARQVKSSQEVGKQQQQHQQQEPLQHLGVEKVLKRTTLKLNLHPSERRSTEGFSYLDDSFGNHLEASLLSNSESLNASPVPSIAVISSWSLENLGNKHSSPKTSVFAPKGSGDKVWRSEDRNNNERLSKEHVNRKKNSTSSPREIPYSFPWDMNRVNVALIMPKAQTDDTSCFNILPGNKVVELLTPSTSSSSIEMNHVEEKRSKNEKGQALERFEFDEIIPASLGQRVEFKKCNSFSKLLELFLSGYKTALVVGSNLSPQTIAEDFILYAIQSSLTEILKKKREKLIASFDITLRISAIKPSENKVCDLTSSTDEFQDIIIGQSPLGSFPLGMNEIDLQSRLSTYVADIRHAFDRRRSLLGDSSLVFATLLLKQLQKTSRVSVLLSSMRFILLSDPVLLLKGGSATNTASHIVQSVLSGGECATLLVGCLDTSQRYREWITLIAMQRNCKLQSPRRLTLNDLLSDAAPPPPPPPPLSPYATVAIANKCDRPRSAESGGHGSKEGVNNPFGSRIRRRSSVVISEPSSSNSSSTSSPVMGKPLAKKVRSVGEKKKREVKSQEKGKGGGSREYYSPNRTIPLMQTEEELASRQIPQGDENDSIDDHHRPLRRQRRQQHRVQALSMVFPAFVVTSGEVTPVQSRVSESSISKDKTSNTVMGAPNKLGGQKGHPEESENTPGREDSVMSLARVSWGRVYRRRNHVSFSE